MLSISIVIDTGLWLTNILLCLRAPTLDKLKYFVEIFERAKHILSVQSVKKLS